MARSALTGVGRWWAALAGRPDPLPRALADRWPALTTVRWRRGGLPPRIGGWCLGRATVAGITLGRTVWLAPHVGWPPALLLHEFAHVRQFARARVFPLAYVWESLRRGYARNRYEREADLFAAAELARTSVAVAPSAAATLADPG